MVEEEMEKMRVAVMGTAIDVDPMEALLWCVRITAGEVAYATQKVHELTEEDVIVNPQQTVEREGGGPQVASEEVTTMPDELNLWIKVRHQATERLAKFSKMALDAGVAERSVRLAEGAGDQLATAISSILVGLQLTHEQEMRAPALVRQALETLEGVNPTGRALLSA